VELWILIIRGKAIRVSFLDWRVEVCFEGLRREGERGTYEEELLL
jgi:hypothetical protein